MIARVVLPANPNHTEKEAREELKASLKELGEEFQMRDYMVNPHNINEYIVVGFSERFEEPYKLHYAINNGYDEEPEFWLIKNFDQSYEAKE